MNVQKITTFASPKNISFKKFEHNEELFKKVDTPEKPTGEGKKWNNKSKLMHRI